MPNIKNNNKKTEKEIISNEINKNETFTIQDTSSVFEVDDCVSLEQDSINPYQFSMLTSPDIVKYNFFLSNLIMFYITFFWFDISRRL